MVDFKTFINSYPNFKDCCIQLFDDNGSRKDDNLKKKIHMKYVDWNKIKEYNEE